MERLIYVLDMISLKRTTGLLIGFRTVRRIDQWYWKAMSSLSPYSTNATTIALFSFLYLLVVRFAHNKAETDKGNTISVLLDLPNAGLISISAQDLP